MSHRTPLHSWHETNGGRMVDFAGWHMPVQYKGIVDEHQAVRERAGIFDISHMGRITFTGSGAEAFLNHLVTNDVTKLAAGQIQYSLVTNEQGKTLDDVLVYKLENRFELVVNASNREKILAWIEVQRTRFEFHLEDRTFQTGMVALQGPEALSVLQPMTDITLSEITYFSGKEGKVAGIPAFISRTGYTGEDGIELIVPRDAAQIIWEKILASGAVLPCGLGARDTLRFEAAMPLYGHELTEETDPLTAGLSFAVKLDKTFVGREALAALKGTLSKKRVGLELAGRRIAREGTPILDGDQVIGQVTSGTFSPTLQKSLAMAFVPIGLSKVGTNLLADIRGTREPAKVVPLPFYRRKS